MAMYLVWILYFGLLSSPNALAARLESGCLTGVEKALTTQVGRAKSLVWESDSPILIPRPDGQSDVLTFSMDSEIPTNEVIKILRSDPQAAQNFDRALRTDVTQNKIVTIQNIMSVMRMSEKQARAFALVKSAAKSVGPFYPSELSPLCYARWM